jgi:hypothetical protein
LYEWLITMSIVFTFCSLTLPHLFFFPILSLLILALVHKIHLIQNNISQTNRVFFFFWKLGIQPKDRLIQGDQTHCPLVGPRLRPEFFYSVWTNWHQGESNLWDLERSTLWGPKPTTRPTQVGSQTNSYYYI